MPEKIVIVGGGQAGGRVAQILANSSVELDISLIGLEPHLPYNRPPLSKGVLLGTSGLKECTIWPTGDVTHRKVRLYLGRKATALHVDAKSVTMDDGNELQYDKLVLATGSRVRRLLVPGAESEGVFALRTFDDAARIAKQFHKGRRLLIVGGGFVGLEIAAAARSQGLETVVVEATNRLLSRVVPQEIGAALARYHEDAGVSFRVGCMVEKLVANRSGKLKSALLSNGETVLCELAIIGVGVTAETSLAKDGGLNVQVGIRTDSSLRSSIPDVYACGDAVSFWHPVFERYVRVEAWQNAEDHAQVVAGQILGRNVVCDTVPFFWSDQYDLSMQIAGIPYFGSQLITSSLKDAQVLYHLDARGAIVAATGLGHNKVIGRKIAEARRLIKRRALLNPRLLKNSKIELLENTVAADS